MSDLNRAPDSQSRSGSALPPDLPDGVAEPTWIRILMGALVGNLGAVGAVWSAVWIFDLAHVGGVLMVVNLLLAPVLVGLVTAWFWRRWELTAMGCFLHALWVAGIGILGAAIFFQEGILCLLMAAPLHWTLVAVSLWLGHRMFHDGWLGLRVSMVPLVFLSLLAESRLAPPAPVAEFVDELHIAAAPAKVWPHVVSFAPIPAPADFWMFRLGLPYPVETPPGADAVGKERLCKFSGGVVFRERVTVFEPEKRLRFQIVEQPADPELLGHFDAETGEFELRAEPDGTTTLIGRSTYRLHTRPRWYFDLWTHHLGRAVHLRVMENARRLAESH